MMMTRTNQKRSSRLNWLRSGSTLAAAAALMAGASAAHAQARPGLSGGISTPGAEITMRDFQGSVRAGASNFRAPPEQVRAPRSIPQRGAPIIANTRANRVAPAEQPSINVNRAPATPVITATPTQPLAQTTGPTSPTPQATTTTNGISVSASATYDDAQVDYVPSAAGDTVNIFGSSAIIDWTTFDAGAPGTEVTFLDAGENLTFTSGQGDYTVLNRIVTPGFDSAVRIDGNVTSNIFGSAITGGTVWFYSAGGLVIGNSATFNIGSLLLSTSQIDPNDVVVGASAIDFTGTPDSASFIRIENGASINALDTNSYVAMVAPRIEQAGTVNVNGSVAYVAAEEATLTIANGLFDISVSVGSEDANGIVHTGNTTGAASTGNFDEQAMYFVAVPKNDAITMLLSGDIGFAASGAQGTPNGDIILTTGSRVERVDSTVQVDDGMGGTMAVPVSSNILDTSVDGGVAGSITLEDVQFSSSTQIFAEDTINLRAGFGGNTFNSISVSGGVDPLNLDLI
ncbi:MAG: hypothetical protein AAFQ27_15050, partial [Pseudomonadota bacterium]